MTFRLIQFISSSRFRQNASNKDDHIERSRLKWRFPITTPFVVNIRKLTMWCVHIYSYCNRARLRYTKDDGQRLPIRTLNFAKPHLIGAKLGYESTNECAVTVHKNGQTTPTARWIQSVFENDMKTPLLQGKLLEVRLITTNYDSQNSFTFTAIYHLWTRSCGSTLISFHL